MKILYVTFHCKPLNSIPGLRTNALLKYLPDFNVEVDVLTRFYDKRCQVGNDFNVTFSEIDELKENHFRVKNIIYTNFDCNDKAIKLSETLPYGVRSIYNLTKIDLYHQGWLKYALKAFEKELSHNKYDFIIGSYGPLMSLEVASKLSAKYKIPWIAEFRDPFIGIQKENKFRIIYNQLIQERILHKCSGIISICEGVQRQVERYGSKKVGNIPFAISNNGIDETIEISIMESDREIADYIMRIRRESKLMLLHTGTIYNGQNIDFFLDSVRKYNSKKNADVKIVCLGLTKDQTNFERLEEKGAIVLERVHNETSLFLQSMADGLIIPAWFKERYTGFVAKIFEYIHSGNNVICSPEPVEDIGNFISQFPNVKIMKDYQDFEQYLDKLIASRNNDPKAKNNSPVLFRKYWIEKLVNFLSDLQKKKGMIRSFS